MMQRSQGFTLIELIAVIAIISILAVAVMMNYPSKTIFNLSSITEQLKRDIRYTQTVAMSLNTPYTINITTNNYSISPNPPRGAYSVTMPTGVTLSASSVTFDAIGTPSNVVNTIITITGTGVGTTTVTIVPETGFVQ